MTNNNKKTIYAVVYDRGWKIWEFPENELKFLGRQKTKIHYTPITDISFTWRGAILHERQLFTTKEAAQAYINKDYNGAYHTGGKYRYKTA